MEAVKGFLPRALPQRTLPVPSHPPRRCTNAWTTVTASGFAAVACCGELRRMGLRNSKQSDPPKVVEGETLIQLGHQTLEAISRFTKSIPEKPVA